jgi:hypothetical protein
MSPVDCGPAFGSLDESVAFSIPSRPAKLVGTQFVLNFWTYPDGE